MAVLVDTSVWIDFFLGNQTVQVLRLKSLIAEEETLIIGDLILVEVLQGIRDGKELKAVSTAFRTLPVAPLVGEKMARRSAALYRALRSQGVTVRRTIDCMIATWCIYTGTPLLHSDRDFHHFASFGLTEA